MVGILRQTTGLTTLSKSERNTVLQLQLASSMLNPGLNGGSSDYTIAGLAWGRSSRIVVLFEI